MNFCHTDSNLEKHIFGEEKIMSIKLAVPETNITHLKPRISVIGVGGGGGNAVNNMIAQNLEGVDFIAMLYDTVGYVALCNICLLAGNVGQFLDLVKQDLPQLPASFQYFVILEELLKGKLQEVPEIEIAATDRFSPAISFIVSAFAFHFDDPKAFATDIYRAKVNAKNCMLHKIESICDLFIASAYIRINSIPKASHILYDVINISQEKGMAGVELQAR